MIIIDFAEGESELVSGFNVEYGGGGVLVVRVCIGFFLILVGLISDFSIIV
jgi:NADH:ubiquinone oxidoreductase subunit H